MIPKHLVQDDTFRLRVALLITPPSNKDKERQTKVDALFSNRVISLKSMDDFYAVRDAVFSEFKFKNKTEYDDRIGFHCEVMAIFQLMLVLMNVLPPIPYVSAVELDGANAQNIGGTNLTGGESDTIDSNIDTSKKITSINDAYTYFKQIQACINTHIATESDYYAETDVSFAMRVAIHMQHHDERNEIIKQGGATGGVGNIFQTVRTFARNIRAYFQNTAIEKYRLYDSESTTEAKCELVNTKICKDMYSSGEYEGLCIATKIVKTAAAERIANTEVRTALKGDTDMISSSTLLLTEDDEKNATIAKIPRHNQDGLADRFINYRTQRDLVLLENAIAGTYDLSLRVDKFIKMLVQFIPLYCHNNIKPANILFDSKYNFYLINFDTNPDYFWRTWLDITAYERTGIFIPWRVREAIECNDPEVRRNSYAVLSTLLTACHMCNNCGDKERQHANIWEKYCGTHIQLRTQNRITFKLGRAEVDEGPFTLNMPGGGQSSGRQPALLGAFGALLLTTLAASLVRR